MDPNVTLAELRQALKDADHGGDWETTEVPTMYVAALEVAAERAQALDEWLSNGGFMPEAWRAPAAARILRQIVTGEHDPLQPEMD